MAEFPALPLWTDAFVADTQHLTTDQVGAYCLLLFAAWRRPNCDLPDDDKFLAKVARCDGRKWRHMRTVLAEFHTIQDGRWRQKRLQKERKYVGDLSNKQRAIANVRWSKINGIADASAMPNACQIDAPIPIPNKKESILSAVPADFEGFWQSYPLEKNMSKKRALVAWRKLTPEDRVQAAGAVSGYRRYCEKEKNWYHAVHAERFLSQERFKGFASVHQPTAEEIEIAKDRADKLLKRGKYAESYQ